MDEVERQRLSAIAHATSAMWGPISEATIEDVVGRVIALGIGPGSRVVDLGCGPAELLRRIAERTGASGIGIDASPFAIEEAQARLAGSAAADRVELRLADVRELDREPAFDLVLCIGPGWDAGGWSSLARWTSALVKAGGHVLLAEGSWRRRPTDPELRTLDMERDAYPPTELIEGILADAGMRVLWSHRSTDRDWTAYGDRYRAAMLNCVQASPDDPLAPRLRTRAGPGWGTYALLHTLLDFVVVLGHPNEASRRPRT